MANIAAPHVKALALQLKSIVIADILSVAETFNFHGRLFCERGVVIHASFPSCGPLMSGRSGQFKKLAGQSWPSPFIFMFEENECFLPILIANSLEPLRQVRF